MKYVLENIADAFTLENWSNLDMIWLVILATAFAVFLCTKVKLREGACDSSACTDRFNVLRDYSIYFVIGAVK